MDQAQSRLAIVSLFDKNYQEVGDLTSQNKFEYCTRHGYSFHLVKHSIARPPAHFSKIPLIETVLALHDWIVWIDSDVLIMNFHTRIEEYLDEDYSLVIGEDWNGINTGVFFLKNTAWSFEFLRRTRFIPRKDLVFFEQDQFSRTLEKDPFTDDHVKVIKLKQSGGEGDFNCYPTENKAFPRHETFEYFDHGDFMVHFVGFLTNGDNHKEFLTNLMKRYTREVLR